MAELNDVTASSLEALSQQYRAIAHNLANATTPGYKRLRTAFVQALEQAMSVAGEAEAGGGETVSGLTTVDFGQGTLTRTGSSLDLALDGKGFFVLEGPEGRRYTRAGRFHVDLTGQLVDSSGRIVLGEGGPIVVPPTVSPTDVHVGRDGTVLAAGQSIGKLEVVAFDDESDLEPVGENAFAAVDGASAEAAESFAVRQGYLESSNVSTVQELVGLIEVTRLYEANIKSVTVQDERLKEILDVAMS
jgi:flagellar basal-body rod protein FlgF